MKNEILPSDYKDTLKQPIIKSLENIENSILVQKQLLKMISH